MSALLKTYRTALVRRNFTLARDLDVEIMAEIEKFKTFKKYDFWMAEYTRLSL